MFSIGEFSRIVSLSIKTIRFYQEKGLLAPSYVNPTTGYRYYNACGVERARIIATLREYDFPLDEIAAMLSGSQDETDLLGWLERRRAALAGKLAADQARLARLDLVIVQKREAIKMAQEATFEVEEKDIPAQLIVGCRMRAKYQECGRGFAELARLFGPQIAGPGICLYYDEEYVEEDADYECCFPVTAPVSREGIESRLLPGGRFACVTHQGPYEELGRSYEKICAYLGDKGINSPAPSRQVYLKGPDPLLQVIPRDYLTEIQFQLAPQNG